MLMKMWSGLCTGLYKQSIVVTIHILCCLSITVMLYGPSMNVLMDYMPDEFKLGLNINFKPLKN